MVRQLPKKLGKNAKVSCYGKAVKGTVLKDKYPNDYRLRRFKFVVKGIETEGGKHVVLMSNDEFPEATFKAFAHSIKLEKPGPPNQYFRNDQARPEVPQTGTHNKFDDDEPVEDDALNGEAYKGQEGRPTTQQPPTDHPQIRIGHGVPFCPALLLTQEEPFPRVIPC